MKLTDNPVCYKILGCCMRVHAVLGNGFLESTYGDALEIEFSKTGVPFVREDQVVVMYDGVPLKTRYRADFTCANRQCIVELKAIKSISDIERAQVRHYLKATRIPYALLVNFGRQQLQYDAFDLAQLEVMRNISGASDKSEFQEQESMR